MEVTSVKDKILNKSSEDKEEKDCKKESWILTTCYLVEAMELWKKRNHQMNQITKMA